MEVLLTQRYNYARIIPLKNYCNIRDKEKYINTDKNGYTELFGEKVETSSLNGEFSLIQAKSVLHGDYIHPVLLTPLVWKTKTKFFYCDPSKPRETCKFEHAYINKNSQDYSNNTCYETSNDRHIREHFMNPFSNISIYTIERLIVRNGDKLTIKYYEHIKTRRVNQKFFKKRSTSQSFSFNFKTGNFIIGNQHFHGKMKGNIRFRCNSFISLVMGMVGNHTMFNMTNFISGNSRLNNEFYGIFDNYEFINRYYQEMGIVNGPIIGEDHFREKFVDKIADKFVEYKKIKVPNEFKKILKFFYPTEKFLKKNDRKLFASVLDRHGIKSKFTIKLLHTIDNINISKLKTLCNLFGDDYPKHLSAIKPDFFKTILMNHETPETPETDFFNTQNYILHDTEKDNLVKIINSFFDISPTSNSNQYIGTIIDHFDMIEKIRVYNPNLKCLSTNHIDFTEEHLELSKMIRAIKKGWVIEYQFDNRMVRNIEEPIKNMYEGIEYTFFPRILKREEEYYEEGTFMHHCVASYSDKET